MTEAGRGERLRQFVQAGMRTPFSWATCNCGLWVCDWIAQERGADPVADVRGLYADEPAVAARIASEGGLAAWTGRIAAVAGLEASTAPNVGDVALVETKVGPALMIITGKSATEGKFYCAWKSPRGVVMAADVTPAQVWTI